MLNANGRIKDLSLDGLLDKLNNYWRVHGGRGRVIEKTTLERIVKKQCGLDPNEILVFEAEFDSDNNQIHFVFCTKSNCRVKGQFRYDEAPTASDRFS